MLWARDLEWSLIGNDNGAGVAYCHGKHREWLMTIKVTAEKKRNWNHSQSLVWIFLLLHLFQHINTHVDIYSNAIHWRSVLQLQNNKIFQVDAIWNDFSGNFSCNTRFFLQADEPWPSQDNTQLHKFTVKQVSQSPNTKQAIPTHISTSIASRYWQIQKAKRKCNISALQWKSVAGHVWTDSPLPPKHLYFSACIALFLQRLIDRRPLSPKSLLNRDFPFLNLFLGCFHTWFFWNSCSKTGSPPTQRSVGLSIC